MIVQSSISVKLIKQTIKENKDKKVKKKLGKSQPNFWLYVKKIEAPAKKWFSNKIKPVYFTSIIYKNLHAVLPGSFKARISKKINHFC